MNSDQNRRYNILVVDDEMVIRDVLEDFLSSEGYNVASVSNGKEALEELEEEHYDALLSDLMMPSMTGIELIKRVKEIGYQIVTVIMTGYGTIETAVQAMKIGADDYILKPFKMDEVLQVLERSFRSQGLILENINLKETVNLYEISETIASSQDVVTILNQIIESSHKEISSDFICLHMFDGVMHPQMEKERYKNSENHKGQFQLDLPSIQRKVKNEGFLLAQKEVAQDYFESSVYAPNSLIAIPIKVSNLSLGMLLAISFSKKVFFREGHRKFLSILATKAASSLENYRLIEELQEANRELLEANRIIRENFRQTILGFARAIEQNDPYTRGHSDRVSEYSRLIAEVMGLGTQFIEDITFAGQLHDIGKIGISPQKLNKAGKLNAPEIRMFRRHPEMGKRILEPIPFMRHLIPGVYCHHEKYDGSGYPQGLKEEDIPLMGRIISVADTYDAMTSDRSYRKALSSKVAIDELVRNSGTQFDPEIVEAFLNTIGKRIDI
jgi:response regulator RpfG family c-di-GMP phosphodiesterase